MSSVSENLDSICGTGNATSVRPPIGLLCVANRKISYDRQPIWREPILRRLNELITLKPGWDGYKGQPVKHEIAAFALSMIEAICGSDTSPPQVVPGPSGDLQIEWHTVIGDVELHVIRPNMVRAWFSDCTTESEVQLTNSFQIVSEWLSKITEERLAIEPAAA